MSSKEDKIIDGNVVKETPSHNHSLRVSMENLRLGIGNVGTVPEKLKQSHTVIIVEQESQGYQGYQQIQEKRQPKMTEKGREYRFSSLEKKRAKLLPRLLRKSRDTDDLMYSYQNSITV